MRRLLALTVWLFASTPAYCVDRDGPRARERDAAFQTIQRHHVIERYRYYVPISAFSQRRSDEPRANSKWRPQQNAPAPDPMW